MNTSGLDQPDYAGVYLNRGIAKAGLKLHNAAITDFDIALRLAKRGGDEELEAEIEQIIRENSPS